MRLDIYQKCSYYFKTNDIHIFNEIDFYRTCPINEEVIKSKIRDSHVVKWRHLGCVWVLLSCNSLTEAAKVMKRNHATIIHAVKKVVNAIEGYDDELLKCLEMLVDNSRKGVYLNYVDKQYNDDIKENELVGLVSLQSNFNALNC